jgi:hypothetical protein
MTGRRAPRDWWPGSRFGRRLTRLPSVPRPAVPLYTVGTAARIDRIRLLYLRGDLPGYPERVRASPASARGTTPVR